MPVKPEVQSILDLVNAADVPIDEQTPEEVRAGFAQLAVLEGEPVGAIVDHEVSGPSGPFTIRTYRPADAGKAARLPVLVWFHGGGFVLGDLSTTDSTARALANGSGAVVASVDYHLAPEHPFPAAVDDAATAVDWVVANADDLGVDPARLAVGGDSAGGNLAAVVSQLAKAARRPAIAFQLLVYPVTDFVGDYRVDARQRRGVLPHRADHGVVRPPVPRGRDGSNPRVSPLRSTDLSGLPPALVITAEFDPLRDEGEAYAAALTAAGVPVEHVRFDGEIHGFFGMDFLPDCVEARALASRALRRALIP